MMELLLGKFKVIDERGVIIKRFYYQEKAIEHCSKLNTDAYFNKNGKRYYLSGGQP